MVLWLQWMRHRRSVAKNLKQSKALLQALESAIQLAESKKRDDIRRILDLSQFAALINRDLSVLIDEMTRPRSDAHLSLHARTAALLAVECFEDFGQLLGRALQTLATKAAVDNEALRSVRELHGDLSRLRKRHESFLRDVRNHALGHRDHDSSEQVRWIRAVKPNTIRELCIEILEWFTRLQQWILQALKESLLPKLEQAG